MTDPFYVQIGQGIGIGRAPEKLTNTPKPAQGPRFNEVLENVQSVRFSSHAQKRLQSRDINLNNDSVMRLSEALEAGARGIPWIASATPAFRAWSAGGILCEDLDEWHLNLRHLVKDGELRRSLGTAGREAARLRGMAHLGKLWLEVIGQVIDAKKVEAQRAKLDPAFSMMER